MKNEYPLMSGPLAINWNYSYKCQLNCSHCYSRNRNEIELSLQDSNYSEPPLFKDEIRVA